MSDTSLVFNAVGRDRGVSSLLSRTAAGVRSANLAGAASTVALGAAWASAAAHGIALAASGRAAAAAVALMPAAVAAGAAVVLAGRAAGFGLADAWKATGQQATAGGGAASNAARQVAAANKAVRDATRALEDAQRSAQDAQVALTRARQDEAERLEDLTRSVAAARLDEEDAVAAVAAAELDLRKARSQGNATAIGDADRAYRRSLQTLEEVRDRVGDLGREQEAANRNGVEGSDGVQSALRRQEDAQRAVADAAERLAEAQAAVGEASAKAASGGIDPAAEALAKLSPAGRAVILTLRALAPAWEGAARVGQQAAFRGVAGDLRALSGTYLPGVTTWLGRMGNSFNVAIRQTLGLATTRSTARDINNVLGATATTTDRLARAVRPVVNGLLQFVAVGAGFLPGLAGDVGGIATSFERWAIAARNSGQMQQWISTGVTTLKQFGTIAWNVVMSVMAIVNAGGNGGSTLDMLVRGSAAMRAWLESAEGQQRVADVLGTLRSVLTGVGEILPVVASHGKDFEAGLNVTGTVVKFVADHLDLLAKALPYVAAGFVISKIAQTGANIAAVAMVPVKVAEVATNWALRTSLNAHTAALRTNATTMGVSSTATKANTAASVVGDAATKRSVFSLAAQKIAMVASAAWIGIVTAAQWLWNAAMSANPIGIIILAVVALIAIIVLIATKTTWFQTIWKYTWDWIKTAASATWNFLTSAFQTWWSVFSGFWTGVGTFFKNVWNAIKNAIGGAWDWAVDKGVKAFQWFQSLPEKIKKAFVNVAGIISGPFKAAFNAISSLWNRTAGRLSFTAPAWIPGIGGKGFSLPQLPMLAEGGIVPATPGGMLAILGEGGQDEAVVPLPKGGGGMSSGRAPSGSVKVIVISDDRAAADYFRRLLAQYGLA